MSTSVHHDSTEETYGPLLSQEGGNAVQSVRLALDGFLTALADHSETAVRAYWVPLPSNQEPARLEEVLSAAPASAPGSRPVEAAFSPTQALQMTSRPRQVMGVDISVVGDAAWAFTVEREHIFADPYEPHAEMVQGVHQFVQVDGAWRLNSRFAARAAAPLSFLSADEVDDADAVRTLIANYYAAMARADVGGAAQAWAEVSWALQATLAPELRNGALVQPFSHSTLGVESVRTEDRFLWCAHPLAGVVPAAVQTWVLGDIAWALVLEHDCLPNRTLVLGYALHQLIRLRGGWKLTARVQLRNLPEIAAPQSNPTLDERVARGEQAKVTAPPTSLSQLARERPSSAMRHGAAPATLAIPKQVAFHRASSVALKRLRGLAQPRSAGLVLVSSLVLAGLGQLAYLQRPPFILLGTVLFLAAIGIFSLPALHLRSQREAKTSARIPVLHPVVIPWQQKWRLAALALSVVFTITLLTQLQIPRNSYWTPFLLWLVSIGLLLSAVTVTVPWRGWRVAAVQHWWQQHQRVTLTLGGLGVIALILRLWQLGGIPATLGGDEGSQGLEAVKVLRGTIRNPFATGWLGVPTMSFYFNAQTIALFGQTSFALRLPWALVGAITVPVVYWLVSRLHGVTLGLMTAVLLATYHYHIHFSRLGSNQVADPLFVALALLFLYRGYDKRSASNWALSGVVIGISQYFYAGARFTGIVVAAVVALWLMRDRWRFWREHRIGIVALCGAALIVAAPMIQYAIRFPDLYNSRINTVGILQSGWLQLAQDVSKQGPVPILIDQFQRATLAFNAYPDRTSWYGSPQPLFEFIPAVLFLLGLGYCTVRFFDQSHFPFVAWWWGGTILGGMLTESPPSSMRLITLAPPATFFVALSVHRLTRLAQLAFGRRAIPRLGTVLAPVTLLLSLSSVKYYFFDYTPQRIYGNQTAVLATELAHFTRTEFGPDWRIYFLGAPRMYVDFGSIPFLAPQVEGVDIREPLAAPPTSNIVKPDKHAAFVLLPERRGELEMIRRAYPEGHQQEVFLAGDKKEPLFTVYRVRQPR